LLIKIIDLKGNGPEPAGPWREKDGMQRELLLTGIGGQGVQLAANVVAHAALAEGRDVQLFGSYGGMMRGGNTEAELVVAEGRVEAPPTIGEAWAAIVLHPDYAESVLSKVRCGGLVLRNSAVFEGPLERSDVSVVDVAATEIAVEAGHVMAAAMVMLGALSTLTGLVTLEALTAGVPECVPPYRQRHLEVNDRAVKAGARSVSPSDTYRAWRGMSASVVRR
jgi:Pyruvate/2-oxoacid:ferredoxin oxidoreductase gamma subunit